MRTPMLVAYCSASTASARSPSPCESRNFSAMILTFQFTPAMPWPLFPRAPSVPATWVPWFMSSCGLLSSFAQSQPRQSST